MTTEQKAQSLISAYEQMVAMMPVLAGGIVEDSVEVCRNYIEALAMLRELEWSDYAEELGAREACPVCGCMSLTGHKSYCRLAALIEGKP